MQTVSIVPQNPQNVISNYCEVDPFERRVGTGVSSRNECTDVGSEVHIRSGKDVFVVQSHAELYHLLNAKDK